MKDSLFSGNVLKEVEPEARLHLEDLVQVRGFIQISAIGLTYLISKIFSRKIRQHLEKNSEKIESHFHFSLSPAQFSVMLGYVIWLFLLWFCQVLFKELQLPSDFIHMAINLVISVAIVRLTYFHIKSTFWSRLIYVIIVVFLALKIFRLWEPAVKLLDSMKIGLGHVEVSIWGLIEAAAIFILLWAAAGAFNRFMAHRLAASERLTTSDVTLVRRMIKAVTITVAVLMSLRAAGIDLTTLAVTGGAIGFAIGIGLQKVGSNLVSGTMLLIDKPVHKGDVITFEESITGAHWGWITEIGPLYVHVTTRDGTLLLIPNEDFITSRIQNLSVNDHRLRLNIFFGVSYKSDLKQAAAMAESAAMNVDRILKVPGPQCLIKEFGDSTVNFQLRAWINDPINGISNVVDAVLSQIWDSFHANGIEIAFPQRDLHIKDTVPLRLYKEDEKADAETG